jgi:hypothetical protein
MRLSDLSRDELRTVVARNTSKDVVGVLNRILDNYSDFQWDGMLYRCGPPGNYYHISKIGALFYEHMGECKQYDLPKLNKILVFDSDNPDMTQMIAGLTNQKVEDIISNGTWVEDIDKCLSILKNAGFDGAVIHGETGRDVTGPPIEVVLL